MSAKISQKSRSTFAIAHRPDYFLAVLVLILIAIGLVMIYSTGWITVLKQTGGSSDKNGFFYTQLLSFTLGIAGWFVASKVRYTFWQKYASVFFYCSLALMFLVLVPGIAVKTNGAARWVHFGPINFQPVEFFKLGTVLFFAAWIEKNRDKMNKPVEGLLPLLLILVIAMVLVVVLQKDMGSAMVIAASILTMYFVSGVSIWMFLTAVGALAAGGVALIISSPFRLARYITFLDHSGDPTGAGYHINQALIALGSGGMVGKGLGKSLQAYGYLPEATNDSIFAIIGEEFGFIGCSAIIGIFMLLLWRGYRIIQNAPDNYAKLVATGIIAWIGFQAFFNISAMLGIIPLTGITLPFISYGGTSMMTLLVAIGILQNISRYTKGEELDENRGLRRRDSRTHNTNSSGHRRPARV
nr:putative lipid II flippase FtsW [Candidatus Saccharibacteria bacterium]